VLLKIQAIEKAPLFEERAIHPPDEIFDTVLSLSAETAALFPHRDQCHDGK